MQFGFGSVIRQLEAPVSAFFVQFGLGSVVILGDLAADATPCERKRCVPAGQKNAE